MFNKLITNTNWIMVGNLAYKDWHFHRWPIMGYLLLGLIAVGILSIANTSAFYVGAVLLISALNIAGIHLTVATVLHERKNQNLTFVMSLPISYGDYTLAKMLVNIGVFLALWLIIGLCLIFVTLNTESLKDGILPFMIIALLELLIAFVLLFAVAIVTESEAISVVFMTVTCIGISLFWHVIGSIEAIGAQMQGDQIAWNPTVLSFIGAELSILVIAITGILYLQSKKTDFL